MVQFGHIYYQGMLLTRLKKNNIPFCSIAMKLKYTTAGMFSYRRTIFTYFASMLQHVLPAIVFGVTINRISLEIEKLTKWKSVPMIFVQLLLSAILLFLIETVFLRGQSFDEEWQATTPGLFFSAVFFGVQTNLYSHITKVF